MITKTQRMNELLDWYEDLLTANQKQVMHFYYQQDLSLREIAEELNVSHNAIYDTIVRATKQLELFESKVKAVAYYNLIQQEIVELKKKNIEEIRSNIEAIEQAEEKI